MDCRTPDLPVGQAPEPTQTYCDANGWGVLKEKLLFPCEICRPVVKAASHFYPLHEDSVKEQVTECESEECDSFPSAVTEKGIIMVDT